MKEVYTVVLIQRCWSDAGYDGFFPQKSFTSKDKAEKYLKEKEQSMDKSYMEYYIEATELQE